MFVLLIYLTQISESCCTFQLIQGQPLWARIFYLVRTGHIQEALDEATQFQQAIEHREASFVNHFRTWIESPDRRYAFLCPGHSWRSMNFW